MARACEGNAAANVTRLHISTGWADIAQISRDSPFSHRDLHLVLELQGEEVLRGDLDVPSGAVIHCPNLRVIEFMAGVRAPHAVVVRRPRIEFILAHIKFDGKLDRLIFTRVMLKRRERDNLNETEAVRGKHCVRM